MTSPKVKECKNKRILKGELKHEYQRRAGGIKEGENAKMESAKVNRNQRKDKQNTDKTLLRNQS